MMMRLAPLAAAVARASRTIRAACLPGTAAVVLAGMAAASGVTGTAAAAGPAPRWVPEVLLVKFAPGVDAAGKASLVPGRRLRTYAASGVEQWSLEPGQDPREAAARLAADARVAYAEPDYLLYTVATPNDPLLPEQWGLHNTGQVVGGVTGTPDADVDAPEAWDIHTGAPGVVVAVLDTGLDLTHPDLAANLWTNEGEIAGNGLDDDANGYIDDVHGWDFCFNDANPSDDSSHGTHCAGIIAAVADNGIGCAGLAWSARIMPLKFQNASGVGSTADAIEGIEYAIAQGADVINASWGSSSFSQALLDALTAANAAGVLVVAAAGNEGVDNDAVPFYPSGYDVPNVISVMATDNRDRRADEYGWASNYGATAVDLAAPGVRIWSTARNSAYMYLSGTSMAAPHVAGALALLKGRFPGLTVAEARFRLLSVGNDEVPALAGLCATGGRLNVRRLIADPDDVPPPAITDLAVAEVASNWVTLAWTSPGDDRALDGWEVRHASAPITSEAAWDAATAAAETPAPAAAGAPVSMRVTGLAASGSYWFAARARDEYANLGALSGSPGAGTLPPPAIAVSPASLSAALEPEGSTVRTLTISNPGPGVLDFTIPHHVDAAAKAVSGGPDGYGYDWIDSDAPDGPDFTWIDIAADGTPVTLTYESNQGPFEIGFPFPYYGGTFTTFSISTHGCLSLSSGWTPRANTELPSPVAPGNLIALLWDEMITGSGTCHFFNDGSRLVVQYTGIENVGTGGPFTMQVRLYPTGVIEYAYLSVQTVSPTGATIGLQNADGTDGLTIAANTAYAHSGLLVRISPPPPWLEVAPYAGSVPAGGSLDVAVTFDAAGLCGSRFDGNLHVLSNAPTLPDIPIAAGLDLAHVPDIEVVPDSLDFGSVRLTEASLLELAITNHGCGELTITGATFAGAGFTCYPSPPLSLAPGAMSRMTVRFSPPAPGTVVATMMLASNDPDEPTVTVALAGYGEFIPDIEVAPTSFVETVPTAGSLTRQLTITNHGLAQLTWSIPDISYGATAGPVVDEVAAAPAGAAAAPAGDDRIDVAGSSGAIDGSAFPDTTAIAALGAGGPDAYGYRWVDSDATRGPAYNWIEIQTTGTRVPITTEEQCLGPYPIGFNFPFYGRQYSTFRVTDNGFITFTTAASWPNNMTIPTSVMTTFIAPYWDDLYLYENSGRIYYRNDGQRLIVEYKNVPREVGGWACSFQVHLYPSGRIEFHYQAMPATTQNATIGIQGHSTTLALPIDYNTDYARANLAVRIEAKPQWLTASPTSGTLGAGDSATVALAIDAGFLGGSTNAAVMHVQSNDPDSPDVSVAATLIAEAGPDPRLSPTSLNLGNAYIGKAVTLPFVLSNIGSSPLQVTGLAIDNAAFTTSTTAPFSVAVGASRTIYVNLLPTSTGPATGTLTLSTDCIPWPQVVLPLAGMGLYAGSAVVTPTTVDMIVQPENERSTTVHVENVGAGDLIWGASAASFNKAAPVIVPGGIAASGSAGDDAPDVTPLGSGGPDAGGYRWLDSDAPGGPVFSWIEIAGTGTAALTSGTTAMSGVLAVGFQVPHYGYSSGNFWVNSEGWICLLPSGWSTVANYGIPTTWLGRSAIAAFWDDLDLSAAGSGDVWYKVVDGHLVVEWDHVMRSGTTTPVTFEIIVSPTGAITFQYLSVSGAITNSATVGIQNHDCTIGLQVAYNQTYLHDGLAIRLWQPRWANVVPISGVIPPGGSADLTLTLDADSVLPGRHDGLLTFQSNDIVRPTITVPLVMEVKDYVSAAEPPRPAVVSLAQNAPNPFNPKTVLRFGTPAAGEVDLRIYDVAGRHVRTLASGQWPAGFHELAWDGRSANGANAPSGVYFCRLRAGGVELTRRMTLLR